MLLWRKQGAQSMIGCFDQRGEDKRVFLSVNEEIVLR